MRSFFNALFIVVISATLLAGCSGQGVTDKSSIASLVASEPPNTALVYWRNVEKAGSKNFFFEDEGGDYVTLGAGEVVQLKLSAGDNVFRVASVDMFGQPSSTDKIVISNDDAKTIYLVLDIKEGILLADTTLNQVDKSTFLKVVNAS
ncbi:hypothetical protein EI983_09110 [Roseovarius faecimaris]|uniref:DUF2846 domain-containing protein n=1 Tax=Roseovarius faecimaris TaxID=2494550 RepID=A0A6I6IRD0_9RHOB|nr:hypothetical protein [Roseovarius faecimaris]QGX98433.1 hypothetical protein EI983_09110 [Roseovarius faecimaris]